MKIQIPAAYEFLFQPAPYKIVRGGRGAGRSWNFARALLIQGTQEPHRILCTRELQNSIADSVHAVLADQINALGLNWFYKVEQSSIFSRNESTATSFIFKGLRHNAEEVKSTEGITRCWLEEAQKTSAASLKFLRPTVRRTPGAEIWMSFNPEETTDPVYALSENPPTGAIVRHINFDQNPYFPAALEEERQDALRRVVEAPNDKARAAAQAEYDNVWLGMCKRRSDAAILKRWRIAEFDTPKNARFLHGLDFGFANDPTAFTRGFILDNTLYIDSEAGGVGIEIDETPTLLDSIPTARDWPIKADGARPETISYLRRQAFNIAPAEKWPGSVEDGIAHLNAFDEIIIHPRCVKTAHEARVYSYKVDRTTGDILPIIVDADNHFIDAIRYSLDGFILKRGGVGVWSKLAD